MLHLELRNGLIDVRLFCLLESMVLCLLSDGMMFEALITHLTILYLTPDFFGSSVLFVISHEVWGRFLLIGDLTVSHFSSSFIEDVEFLTAGLEYDLGMPISRISAYLPGPLRINCTCSVFVPLCR